MEVSFILQLGYVFEGLLHEREDFISVCSHRAELKPIGRSDKKAELCIKNNFLFRISKKAVQDE